MIQSHLSKNFTLSKFYLSIIVNKLFMRLCWATPTEHVPSAGPLLRLAHRQIFLLFSKSNSIGIDLSLLCIILSQPPRVLRDNSQTNTRSHKCYYQPGALINPCLLPSSPAFFLSIKSVLFTSSPDIIGPTPLPKFVTGSDHASPRSSTKSDCAQLAALFNRLIFNDLIYHQ